MTVTFRHVGPEDYQAVCGLILDQEELFLTYPKGKYPLTAEQLERLLARRIEPTVLLVDGAVAGFANFYNHKERKSVFIGNVLIDRSRRGKGLGKRIVAHMIDLAFGEYELPVVRISVFSRNTEALLLYGSFGFKPYAMDVERDYRGDRVANLHLRLKSTEGDVSPNHDPD